MSTNTEHTALETTYLPAIVASSKTLFSTLLRWDVEPEPEGTSSEFVAGRDISGIIGFSGALRGTIVISFDEAVAFCAVAAFLGDKPTEIDSDVCDTVAELANMIAGGVKDHIKLENIALGMPATVSGTGHTVLFDTGAEVERVTFHTPVGCVTMQIAVRKG